MTRIMKKNRIMKLTSVKKRTNAEVLAPISLCELGLPYILAEFRNRHLLFIVDTGATESIIDSRVFLLLKEELKTREAQYSEKEIDVCSGNASDFQYHDVYHHFCLVRSVYSTGSNRY